MAAKLKLEYKVTDSLQIVNGVADILDVPMNDVARKELVAACEKYGGVKALDKPDAAANLFARLTRVMFAIPEFQLC